MSAVYDLLLRNGRVIDPTQHLDAIRDVAVSDGRIAKVEARIAPHLAREVVDADNKLVTPGIIDCHCHVAGDLMNLGADNAGVAPDTAGVKQGVTTVVDGGSAGAAVFPGFRNFVVPFASTRVFCFLHLGLHGLSIMPELEDEHDIDVELAARTVSQHRGLVKGIKLRLLGGLLARDGIKVVSTAKALARECGLPVMIHMGDLDRRVAPDLTQKMLPLLETGDILSHVFSPQYGGAVRADGTALPELQEAMDRGVVLDCAMGNNHFSFKVFRALRSQGFTPTTISTDLSVASIDTIFGMPASMSKLLALGLDLADVIRMSTINPARAIGEEDRLGSLKAGKEADISVMELRSGRWRFVDASRDTLEVSQLLVPILSVRSGRVIAARPVTSPRAVE